MRNPFACDDRIWDAFVAHYEGRNLDHSVTPDTQPRWLNAWEDFLAGYAIGIRIMCAMTPELVTHIERELKNKPKR